MSNSRLIFGTMPIGNLDDSTYNLIGHIQKSDVIAVENEEAVKNIINHYNLSSNAKIISISPKVFINIDGSKNQNALIHRWKMVNEEIFESIDSGKIVLCLSDEGSAIVTDPFDVVRQLAISNNIQYAVLPGPSSIISAISYSKLYDGESFSFHGMIFYSPKKLEIYRDIRDSNYPSVIFYHHEIQEIFFNELFATVGKDRKATLLSNLTTKDEIIFDGHLSDILEFVLKNDVRQPTLVIAGKEES